jgi:hypothetical protein
MLAAAGKMPYYAVSLLLTFSEFRHIFLKAWKADGVPHMHFK